MGGNECAMLLFEYGLMPMDGWKEDISCLQHSTI